MPRGANMKLKFTYLMKIMLEKTDDEHSLTMPQILRELEGYGISAERKSIYGDLQDMEQLGVEVIKEQIGKETFYHVGSRQFELAEVKLLIDAILSSKFITRNKSSALIAKVKTLVSDYQARSLQRQVYVGDRVKTMNESVYYNVDDIYTAIGSNKKISFKYYRWDINGRLIPTHDGNNITVSPWALIWDDENYYLVAYDSPAHLIKHYRVDKMMKIALVDEMREGKEEFDSLDMRDYSKATFGMYRGEKKKVRIRLDNSLCGIFIDRFGKDISFRPLTDSESYVSVNVNVSPQFFGWLFGLGSGVSIMGPEEVVTELEKYTRDFLAAVSRAGNK
ncbi:helix-turn-helix transcriptional regulator [Butyrivibrio sp. MC2013]|uniref:helix-turn-helix transcriptional regulator n=1 Tax=Butyrivibrio sp. MC2013 TaxID=1280686 RepID=UPI0004069A41|nr:WYL domain-containing protein [Butyrivibrio sp. MC2013]